MAQIDKRKLTNELKDKYSVENNALRLDKIKNAELDRKGEPKDEINVIVGDDKRQLTKDLTLYVVSGFMRTGTSMMMRALEAGGLDAEYQQSREEMRERFADDHYDPNIGGLYELEKKDYKKPNFPRDYEGKLIKCLNQGVSRMRPMENGIRVVFMRRDREEIRQSYLAFFDKNLRIGRNFQDRMDMTVEMIKNRKDVLSCHEFWYRDVVKEPEKHFQELKDSGWEIDVEKATKVVDPKYCRYKKEELTEGII